MNRVLSSLLTDEREIEGLKRPKKMMWYICFLVNWSYFIMGSISFNGKKFGPY
jgi:hypothetical protein